MASVGITGLGVYVPCYRVAPGAGGGRGERACAGHDQDSLTLGVEAALGCLASPGLAPDGLCFASTTSPYGEKQVSTLLAAVLGLPRYAFTADLASSVRGGTAGIQVAAAALAGGLAREVLVVAADCRLAEPGSDAEFPMGDAAAALCVGPGPGLATIEAVERLSEEFLDAWRAPSDRFVRRGDSRFILTRGYERLVGEVLRRLLERAGLEARDLRRVVLPSPDGRVHLAVARALGLAPGAVEDPLTERIGDAGAAAPLLGLAAALEAAGAGDLIAVVGYGAGAADALLLRATGAPGREGAARKLASQLARGQRLSDQLTYLRLKGLLPQDGPEPFSSWALLWRDMKEHLQLLGVRCRRCGRFFYPRRRVCLGCRATDEMDDAPLARRGRVFTFTRDQLFPLNPTPPTLMAVADLEGGGRFYGEVADCAPDALAVGMPVELTFRRYHTGGGFPNYFWKLRPAEA